MIPVTFRGWGAFCCGHADSERIRSSRPPGLVDPSPSDAWVVVRPDRRLSLPAFVVRGCSLWALEIPESTKNGIIPKGRLVGENILGRVFTLSMIGIHNENVDAENFVLVGSDVLIVAPGPSATRTTWSRTTNCMIRAPSASLGLPGISTPGAGQSYG